MTSLVIPPSANVSPITYHMGQINSIYNIPKPVNEKYVVAIASFSGGLHCRMKPNGIVKTGDCKTYWTNIGIPIENHPQVIIVPLKGEKNSPNGQGTFENTMDVEIIGGACPSSNLTILLYLTNMKDTFYSLFSYIYENPLILNGVTYKPNVITCCWNIPEDEISTKELNRCNDLFKKITDSGINICVASGDRSAVVTFPASSPYVTAIGGTSLKCSNSIYNSFTNETVWKRTGSGISKLFPKPIYQTQNGNNRCIPDLAFCANPNTGILLYYNNKYVTGGGTSAAAPIFSGYLAAIGCKKFVNPLLYSAPKDCYHDIRVGSNHKYIATRGPDLCTGLGSIDGTRLKYILISSNSNKSTPVIKEPVKATPVIKEPVKATPVIKEAVKEKPITKYINVESIRLSSSKYTLKCNLTKQLVAYILPYNSTNRVVKWSCSSKNISVDQNGIVKGLKVGTGLVNATSESGNKIATCEIIVV